MAKTLQKKGLQAKKERIELLILLETPMKEWETLIEELDQLRVEGILTSEKRCRNLKMGNVPWSPELQQSMNRIGYYQRCRLKYCAFKNVNSRTLQYWFKKCKVQMEVKSGNKAINRLREEFKMYNAIKKQAPEKIQLFLESLAEATAEEGDLSKENILKQ
jgi:hypothetical protein